MSRVKGLTDSVPGKDCFLGQRSQSSHCPYMVRGEGSLCCLFIRTLTPFTRALPSWPNHYPKTLSPNVISLRIRCQHTNLGEDTNIQSAAEGLWFPSVLISIFHGGILIGVFWNDAPSRRSSHSSGRSGSGLASRKSHPHPLALKPTTPIKPHGMSSVRNQKAVHTSYVYYRHIIFSVHSSIVYWVPAMGQALCWALQNQKEGTETDVSLHSYHKVLQLIEGSFHTIFRFIMLDHIVSRYCRNRVCIKVKEFSSRLDITLSGTKNFNHNPQL